MSPTSTVAAAAVASVVVVAAAAMIATRHMRHTSGATEDIQDIEPTDEEVFGPEGPTHFYPANAVIDVDDQAVRVCEAAV